MIRRLGLIYRKAQNKVQDPAKLERLIKDLIDRENWSAMGTDVKGDAYEGLLEKSVTTPASTRIKKNTSSCTRCAGSRSSMA